MSIDESENKPGDLMVWHVPQVPMRAFKVRVTSIEEGKRLCEILADYDLFQYENNIKPDYSNANGVSRWEDDGEGNFDWYDTDLDEDWDD